MLKTSLISSTAHILIQVQAIFKIHPSSLFIFPHHIYPLILAYGLPNLKYGDRIFDWS